MASSGDRVRWTVLFSGQVQGVGFRYTTSRVAARHPVTGYVKNLPDGRVEMVAEGAQKDLQGLVQDVEEAMAGHIRETQRDESPGTGQFHDFSIRH